MTLIINPGSRIGKPGNGWTNTAATALAHAKDWLTRMHAEGMADVELLDGEIEREGRWTFTFRHAVTGKTVELEMHGIDDVPAYEREHIFAPRVYWNGSSTANPELDDFATPGFEVVRTFRAAVTETKAPQQPPPLPTFPHRIYGVNLTLVGDEGAMMADGHVPLIRFVAACNNMARNEFGCRNLLDYSEATLAEALEGTRHTWVLPAGNPDGDCDWYVKYNAAVETPGAIPVTLWEP
jgi:hypothetical protein